MVKIRELFQGLEAAITGVDVDVGALVCDSRKVSAGCLFAALVGARADGHDHVAAAIAAGASAVLVERSVEVEQATSVVVKSSRLALAQAARRFYGDPSADLKMVGVTGTSGKTTTVHLLESIFAAADERPAIIGTLGTRFAGQARETGLTTPESVDLVAMLAEMRGQGATAVAMEVSSHALQQERVAGLSFDVGIFTNLTHDHLDYHGTMEAYFAAKSRLIDERLKPGGFAVLNLEDPRVRTLMTRLPRERTIGFSLSTGVAGAALEVTSARIGGGGIELALRFCGQAFTVSSQLIGRFNAANILAAIAAGLALGMSPAAIAAGVAAMKRVPGRLDRVTSSDGPLVLVDYAHKPDALSKALETLRELGRGRVFCVFGCGGDRDQQKRPVMGEVAVRLADWSVLTSDNPRSEDPGLILAAIEAGCRRAGATRSESPKSRTYHVEPDRALAIALAVKAAKAGDIVLIAGKGHESYQIVGSTKQPFDDYAQGRLALNAAGFRTEG
jgi:UDP-N-acetylmuramoyl-L-alanyl-D-glutamate--2,6-diaminopimelate ligase